MLDAKLVIVAGADSALEYKLHLPTTVGRSRENDIELPHPLVSRRHCEIVDLNGRLFVRDLGSLNGTFVGNKPAEDLTEIAPGQLLTIGTVTFRALYADFDSAMILGDSEDDVDVTAGTSNGQKFETDAATTMIARKKLVSGDTAPLDQTVRASNGKKPAKK